MVVSHAGLVGAASLRGIASGRPAIRVNTMG